MQGGQAPGGGRLLGLPRRQPLTETLAERAKSARAKAASRLAGESSLTDVDLIKYRRKLERADMRLRLANLK